MWWRDGSTRKASGSRSKGPRFESRQEHEKYLWVCPSQKRYADLLSVCPTPVCIRTYKNDYVRTRKNLYSMSEVGGLRKHKKTQHALKSNSWAGASYNVVVTVLMKVCEWVRAIHVSVRVAPVRGALSHGDYGNCAYSNSSFIHSFIHISSFICSLFKSIDMSLLRK